MSVSASAEAPGQAAGAAGYAGPTGILLVNSGTPEAATPPAVRAFLARFLSDPRVVQLPRLLWLPLLYGIVLPRRPHQVARKYRQIWSERGSPLRFLTLQLRGALAEALARRLAPQAAAVEAGMLYSSPELTQALAALQAAGARRVLVLPLFPQYCGATTGAVFDHVNAATARLPAPPQLRFVNDYHNDAAYLDALAASIAARRESSPDAGHLLISFHGIPQRSVDRGDPYQQQCQATARALAARLRLADRQWSLAFQSRFGAARWLTPYTRELLRQLPARGERSVTVVCPGFAVDCLETLEEIALENRAAFLAAGGEHYDYVPALNDGAPHAAALAALVLRHAADWLEPTAAAAGAHAGCVHARPADGAQPDPAQESGA
ncbi:MAG: ferrochelatase [Proteobacteria bacterium]|nr:ferrochelatase [Pseudomonadota bacterium]